MLGAGSSQTRSERVGTFDLGSKPITRALLLRGAQIQDETILLAKRLGSKRTFEEESSLSEFAASCASTVAITVSFDSLKKLDRRIFFPNEPVPKYAPMVVAFSLFVLESIYAHLSAEDVHFDFPKTAAETAGLFFIDHHVDERNKYAKQGLAAFESIRQVDLVNVKEWRDTFFKMVPVYLLQRTTTKQDLRQIDFGVQFASKLSALFKAGE